MVLRVMLSAPAQPGYYWYDSSSHLPTQCNQSCAFCHVPVIETNTDYCQHVLHIRIHRKCICTWTHPVLTQRSGKRLPGTQAESIESTRWWVVMPNFSPGSLQTAAKSTYSSIVLIPSLKHKHPRCSTISTNICNVICVYMILHIYI